MNLSQTMLVEPADHHGYRTELSSDEDRFRIGVVTIADGMRALQGDWETLEHRFSNPLLSYDWFLSCAEAFTPVERLHVVTVSLNGRVIAIAPLSESGATVNRIALLGSKVLNEPGGVLYSDGHALGPLFSTVLMARVPLILKGLRSPSPEVRALESAARASRRYVVRREERLPWVSTACTWESFERGISPSRRSSLRRLERLAAARGSVRLHAVIPGPDDLAPILRELFEVEATSWKGRAGTAMKNFASLGRFFTEYAIRSARRRRLHVFFLRVNGVAIAAQLTVVLGDRLWIFKIGHDERWSWCSPGILLMHRVLRYCIDHGLVACEFLGSDEPWLHIWTNEFHNVVTYRVYPSLPSELLDLSREGATLPLRRAMRSIARLHILNRGSNHA